MYIHITEVSGSILEKNVLLAKSAYLAIPFPQMCIIVCPAARKCLWHVSWMEQHEFAATRRRLPGWRHKLRHKCTSSKPAGTQTWYGIFMLPSVSWDKFELILKENHHCFLPHSSACPSSRAIMQRMLLWEDYSPGAVACAAFVLQ